MIVFATWNGGSSYSPSSIPEDVERFDSIGDAKYEFWARYNLSVSRPFEYVNRDSENVEVPAVSEDSEMWLYFGDPSEERDPYPDRIVKFGPRGGVRVERC